MDAYTLIPVTASDIVFQTVLLNLTKMYCCEWSQYNGMDVNEQGVYIFEKFLHNYWEKPECKAFLLQCAQNSDQPKWAGFALMDRDFVLHKDFDYSMAEFYVLYKYRGRGAGRYMATTLFDRFPGKWELGRNPKNKGSVAFWDRVIADYTGNRYELVCASPEHRFFDGTLGDVFAFIT